MPRPSLDSKSEVKTMNQTQSTGISEQLARQGFEVLPIRIEDARVAYHTSHDERGVCCDLLVFQVVTKEGRALFEEATALFRSLEKLPPLLCESSHRINPNFRSHTISFLGKKAFLLSNETEQLLKCRLHPLLLIQPTHLAPSPGILAAIQPIQVLQISALDSYLTQISSSQLSEEESPNHSFKYLRRAYDDMSIAGILFALLIGLSGIMWGMNQFLVTLLLAFGGIFTPALILRRAKSNFRQFQLHHSFTIQSPTAIRTVDSNRPTPSPSSRETTSHSLDLFFQNHQRREIPQTNRQG